MTSLVGNFTLLHIKTFLIFLFTGLTYLTQFSINVHLKSCQYFCSTDKALMNILYTQIYILIWFRD